MSNSYDSENIDTIIEEVLEDLITAVMSDSSVRQIETTVHAVGALGYRSHGILLQRPSSTGHRHGGTDDTDKDWSTLWFTWCRKRYPPCHKYSLETHP